MAQIEEKEEFFMSPKVDFAFKEIMVNDKVRRGFLSAVLGMDASEIKETVIRNTNLRKLHEDEKQSVLDVLVTMNNNTEVNIEIQVRAMKTWAKRSTFYLCKMVADQPDINMLYSNIRKCVAINLLDFDLLNDTEDFHSVYHLNEDHRHTQYTDILELHIIELNKLPKNPDGTSLYNWVRFLQAKRKEEFEMIAQTNEYIQEAYKQLEVISQDEQKRLEYLARQKAIGDYNTLMYESREDGIAEGVVLGKFQTLTDLVKKGLLSITDAAVQVNMTETEFKEKAGL